MRLIFLYGPPAVGKLTVAKDLARVTGFPLVDNHSLVNPLARVFGWDHPERKRLGRQFRLELFASAAREGISIITTFGGGGATYDDFIQDVKTIVEKNGGEVVFVRLMAPKDVLLDRVRHDSRAAHEKMTAPDLLLRQLTEVPDNLVRALVAPHLEIDTSIHSAKESANLIVERHGL